MIPTQNPAAKISPINSHPERRSKSDRAVNGKILFIKKVVYTSIHYFLSWKLFSDFISLLRNDQQLHPS